MSVAAIVPIIEFVGTAYAAKTAVDGIAEGNWKKAVIGGVGAYLGASGLVGDLGTAATTADAAAANGTQAGAAMAADAGTGAAAGVAGSAAGDISGLGASAAGDGSMLSSLDTASGQVLGDAAPAASNTLASSYAASQAPSAMTPAIAAAPSAAGQGTGLLDWAHSNPMLANSMLQMGGAALAGSAQQDWQQKLIDEQNQLNAESRARKGYWAPSAAPMSLKYNPRTGQFE